MGMTSTSVYPKYEETMSGLQKQVRRLANTANSLERQNRELRDENNHMNELIETIADGAKYCLENGSDTVAYIKDTEKLIRDWIKIGDQKDDTSSRKNC